MLHLLKIDTLCHTHHTYDDDDDDILQYDAPVTCIKRCHMYYLKIKRNREREKVMIHIYSL